MSSRLQVLSGNGQRRLALLDSGNASLHSYLSEIQKLEYRSFIGADPYMDELGHGTSMVNVFCDSLKEKSCPIALAIGQVIGEGVESSGETLAVAIHWAVESDISIVMIPLGTMVCHPALRDATEYASAHSVSVFAAAGNPCQGQRKALYPAALPGVVSVGDRAYRNFYATWNALPDLLVDLPYGVEGSSGATIIAACKAVQSQSSKVSNQGSLV